MNFLRAGDAARRLLFVIKLRPARAGEGGKDAVNASLNRGREKYFSPRVRNLRAVPYCDSSTASPVALTGAFPLRPS